MFFRVPENNKEKTKDPLNLTFNSALSVQISEPSSLTDQLKNELTIAKTEIEEECNYLKNARTHAFSNNQLGFNQINAMYYKDNVKEHANASRNFRSKAKPVGDRLFGKTFTCRLCGKVFDDKATFRFHMTQEEKLYFCHHCGSLEKLTKMELVEHCKLHGIVRTGKLFKKALAKTPRNYSRPQSFFCEICSTEFTFKTELDKHCEFEHKDHYKCEICSVGSNNLLDYIFHVQTHNEDKSLKCPLCPFVTFKNSVIKVHLANSHEEFRQYKCNVCDKRFGLYYHFVDHKKYFHAGEKTFQCDTCGKKFMYLRYLKSHATLMHTKIPEDGLKCPICEESFESASTLIEHRRRKHSTLIHVCEVCGKVFKERQGLAAHANVHSDIKRYVCSICKREFSRKSYLTQHKRIHTGEKPHVCPHCGKKFTQRSSMVTHTRRHTGERPYGCQLCNKRFVCGNLLTNHRKTCKGLPVSEK